MTRLPRGIAFAIGVGLPLALLARGIARVLPFVADDALISFRYAARWLDGRGLTWTDGDAVEGYSNLAWIVLCAGLGAFGVDLVTAARVLGVLATGGLFVAVYRFATRDGGAFSGALVANALLALLGTVYVWAVGGLETPLVAMCLGLGWMWTDALLAEAVGSARWRTWALGATWATLVLARPDGPLFVAVSALGLLWHHRGAGPVAVRWGLPVVALPLAAWLGQLGFRLAYYGDWLPNPARMKADVSQTRLVEGLGYLGEILVSYAPLVAMAGFAALGGRDPRVRRTAPVLLVSMLAWSLYVASVGGDIFPAHRHGAPIAVGLALLVVLGHDAAIRSARGRAAFVGAAVVAVGALAWGQPRIAANHRAVTERWEWDVAVVGRFLGEAFADERPLVAVTAAGSVPWFSGLPALDLFGLNDRHIARTPSRGGRIGHDRGDGEYVLSREPDLVIFGLLGQYAPTRAYARDFPPGSRFFEEYAKVSFRGIDPWRVTNRSWLRRGGRLDVRVEDDVVIVPGYRWPGTVGELGPDGSVVGRWSGLDEPAPLSVDLPPGRWRATWPVDLGVEIDGGVVGSIEGRHTWVVGPAALSITLRPHIGTWIPAIAFEMAPGPPVAVEPGPLSLPAEVVTVPVGGVLGFRASTEGRAGEIEAWSDPLVVPEGGVLTLELRGTPDERRVHVLVWRDDRPVLSFTPDRRARRQAHRLVGLDGDRVRLQLVDRAPRGKVWGAVSDVRLLQLVALEE